MRNFHRLCTVVIGSALLAASAHAQDNPATTNVFNADMSNPDLAAVITSFQEVCLPFIAHTTELPQRANMEHYSAQLTARGYEFQSAETRSRRVLVGPGEKRSYKSPPDALVPGYFTVYNGKSYQVVPNTKTIVNPIGEIGTRPRIEGEFRTLTRISDKYLFQDDLRQTASLEWNYASQNHPAKSCEIRLDDASIPAESFEADFIQKDADWYGVFNQDGRWSQCSRDGEDEFEFIVERRGKHLTLSVRRNDFYEPDICINWLSARQAFP